MAGAPACLDPKPGQGAVFTLAALLLISIGARIWLAGHVSPGRRPGRIIVTLGRAGWGGADVSGRVRISVGRPAPSGSGLAKVFEVRRWVVHRLAQRSFVFDVPPPPVRVEIQVSPTFSPSTFGLDDTRQLGAQVSFRFDSR